MDEFGLIERYFAPLARNFPGSLNLTDDAALLDIPAGQQLLITKDAISEGVHFIGNEDPALIAQKLLRVNLSDLAAMGATPLCYFLALTLPKSTTPDWLARFASGLASDQQMFNIHLAGGDTTATNGPISLSLTALGLAPTGAALRRSGAKPGDAIYVSGTLGDSALGLLSLQNKLPANAFLQTRYHLPEPRLALGEKLRGIASACIDISDGLLQDLGHICKTSHVGATIERSLLPLSEPARALLESDTTLWENITSGGDDYELLITIPQEKISEALPLTRIGVITEEKNILLLDENGTALPLTKKGFQHF